MSEPQSIPSSERVTAPSIPFEPAQLRRRYDGWTAEKQIRFIEALATSKCVDEACRIVGMSDTSAYQLRNRPCGAAFARAWDLALDCQMPELEQAAFHRARYGVPRPSLQQVADVGEGVYAIAFRPPDEDLARAIDVALGEMASSGELRAILERWRLWDGRQGGLDASAVSAGPARTLGWQDVRLFLRGAVLTIVISSAAMLLAIAGGLVLSLARRYGGRVAAVASTVYVEVFRGTPVLLQLYVLYYGLAPLVALDALTAAVLGLGLNYAAYESEL